MLKFIICLYVFLLVLTYRATQIRGKAFVLLLPMKMTPM